ncbi:MAG TPA: helix-turn-helix transcriptional regulator [Vicinamibacterales bacterium]|jgi:transcriptional regulator with XRE-family HTH domain
MMIREVIEVQRQWLGEARRQKGWTQKEAAARLGVSQAYLSLLEHNLRPVSKQLLPKLQTQLEVPATELPVEALNQHDPQQLAEALGALGYPGFAYLKRGRRRNPVEVLFAALVMPNLETRLAEALPWVAMRHPDLNWEWLLERVKVRDVQNRLGFVVTLAHQVTERKGDHATASKLAAVERQLERSRLANEDTFCRDAMTETERRWLQNRRPPDAARWHLLTDLRSDQLPYAT